jgi:hypothetical protein
VNELLQRLYGLIQPQDVQQAATSPITSPQLGMLNRMLGLSTGQAETALQRMPEQLAQSQALLSQYEPGGRLDPRLMDQFMNLATMGPMGMTKAVKWSLPKEYDDVTKLPIPKEFGGVKTEEYLFHGGIRGKLDPKSTKRYLQGAEKVNDIVPTSFSKSPQEALEYTTIAGGDLVAIPKSALNIYKGGNETLNKAVMSNNMQVLKDAGFDGVDFQAITPGGYREVVVWELDKVINKALYAPVRLSDGEIAITQPLKSLLD